MKCFKSLIIITILVLNFLQAKAQQIEIGMLLGASQYIGDLSDEAIRFQNTHFAASLFGRYNFTNRIAVKGMMSYGRVSGFDNQSSIAASKIRNLNFYSDILEFGVHFEYNLLKNDLKNLHSRPFIPYVFAGIGVFKFNPKTDFAGKIYELQPLGTEGQGSTAFNNTSKYNLTEISFPVGIGFRTRISDAFYLGIEAGLRYTNTNYLDDVGGKYATSTVRANSGREAALLSDRSWEVNPIPNMFDPTLPNPVFNDGDKRSYKKIFENDIFIITGVTLTYILRTKGQACPSFN